MARLSACVIFFLLTLLQLRGAVTDPSGSAVPNAIIFISPPGRTARSDDAGRYAFGDLPPGKHKIHVTAPGFADYDAETPDSGELYIRLSLRVQAEQVTVTADTQAKVDTDPSNNAGALVISKAELDALPDDPDDLAADLQELAGPAAGPNGGQIFIDGFTGGHMPSKQSIREIRVNQNPFAAQFDKPGQGRIEILTRPGTEDFHGELTFQFSNTALYARDPLLPVKAPYERKQWEGSTSGPIGRKTSFFFDFERRDFSTYEDINALTLDADLNQVHVAQPALTPASEFNLSLRIDRQLSLNHTLSVRYEADRHESDNQGVGGFSLAGTGYNSHESEGSLQVVETGVLSATTINETRFRFYNDASDDLKGSSAPITTVLDAFTSGGSPVGNSFSHARRYELQNFTTHIAGAHSARFGGLMRGVRLNEQASQNYNGTFTFTSLDSYRQTLLGLPGGGASQFAITAGNPLASLSQFDFALYAQDDWRISPRLSLSTGLRYEFQTNAGDWSDVAPRLGLAWAQTPKTVFRAGTGIFYERLSESLTLDALLHDGIRQQSFLIQNPDFYPAVPPVATLLASARPQTIRETDPHWHAPLLIQAAFGVERQISKSITLTSNYIHTSGSHALRSRNVNAPLPGTAIRPYGGVNSLYLYETTGIYRQNQWITNLNIKAGQRLTLNAFYTLGSARSNTDGPQTFPDNQYDLSTEYGRAVYDIRHDFHFQGTLTTKYNFRLSPFLTMTSGRPYNITTGQDANGDGLYTDRPMVNGTPIPRNSGNGPGYIGANLRLAKAFRIGEKKPSQDAHEMMFSVNARNVLNHPNLAPPDGNLSSPFFGHSLSILRGRGATASRRLELQVRFTF